MLAAPVGPCCIILSRIRHNVSEAMLGRRVQCSVYGRRHPGEALLPHCPLFISQRKVEEAGYTLK